MELSFRSEGVHAPVGDDRNGPRSFVEAEVVAVVGPVREAPLAHARPRVERLDDLFATPAMKQNDAPADDDRAGEAFPARDLPDLRPPILGPRLSKRRPAVDAVAVRAEKLRPVRCSSVQGVVSDDDE